MTREEAKREMLFAKREVVADSWIDKAYDVAIEALSEPERKKGKWLSEDGAPVVMKNGCPVRSCYCSECGEWLTASDEYYVRGNFCPNCGADMRGEGNGNE